MLSQGTNCPVTIVSKKEFAPCFILPLKVLQQQKPSSPNSSKFKPSSLTSPNCINNFWQKPKPSTLSVYRCFANNNLQKRIIQVPLPTLQSSFCFSKKYLIFWKYLLSPLWNVSLDKDIKFSLEGSEFPHEGNLKIFQGFGNLNTLQDQKFHHLSRYYWSFHFLCKGQRI